MADELLRRSDHRHVRSRRWPWLVVLALVAAASPAEARQDMAGPDWMRLSGALPALVLQVLGSIAVVLAPVLLLATVVSWFQSRKARRGRGITALLLGPTILTMALAAYHWRHAPPEPAGGFMGNYRPSPRRAEPRRAPIAPPAGGEWPARTGYLDMPQLARGGRGIVIVRQLGTLPYYVKLCVAGEAKCPGLRHAVVYGGEFEFRDLTAGRYEVRYMPIQDPSFAGRSQRPIVIGEDGLAHTKLTLSSAPTFINTRDDVVAMVIADF